MSVNKNLLTISTLDDDNEKSVKVLGSYWEGSKRKGFMTPERVKAFFYAKEVVDIPEVTIYRAGHLTFTWQ